MAIGIASSNHHDLFDTFQGHDFMYITTKDSKFMYHVQEDEAKVIIYF